DDPSEKNNLAKELPDLTKELKTRLMAELPGLVPADEPKSKNGKPKDGVWEPGFCTARTLFNIEIVRQKRIQALHVPILDGSSLTLEMQPFSVLLILFFILILTFKIKTPLLLRFLELNSLIYNVWHCKHQIIPRYKKNTALV
ncbi:unnamed protein product, partial [Meganyctiphanes norvegica]